MSQREDDVAGKVPLQTAAQVEVKAFQTEVLESNVFCLVVGPSNQVTAGCSKSRMIAEWK